MALEKEADVMGAKSLALKPGTKGSSTGGFKEGVARSHAPIQMKRISTNYGISEDEKYTAKGKDNKTMALKPEPGPSLYQHNLSNQVMLKDEDGMSVIKGNDLINEPFVNYNQIRVENLQDDLERIFKKEEKFIAINGGIDYKNYKKLKKSILYNKNKKKWRLLKKDIKENLKSKRIMSKALNKHIQLAKNTETMIESIKSQRTELYSALQNLSDKNGNPITIFLESTFDYNLHNYSGYTTIRGSNSDTHLLEHDENGTYKTPDLLTAIYKCFGFNSCSEYNASHILIAEDLESSNINLNTLINNKYEFNKKQDIINHEIGHALANLFFLEYDSALRKGMSDTEYDNGHNKEFITAFFSEKMGAINGDVTYEQIQQIKQEAYNKFIDN